MAVFVARFGDGETGRALEFFVRELEGKKARARELEPSAVVLERVLELELELIVL